MNCGPLAAGTQQYQYVGEFSDGSVALAGMFGTSAVFAPGESNEETFVAQNDSDGMHAYVARYGNTGALQWAKQLAVEQDTLVDAVAAGADGTTYLVFTSQFTGTATLAAGELDLPVANGEGAVLALDRDGHYVHQSRYKTTLANQMHLLPAADGGVLVAGTALADVTLGEGTPNSITIPTGSSFYARYDSTLTLKTAYSAPFASRAVQQALFADGGAAFGNGLVAALTLGAGPHAISVKAPQGNEGAAVVARYDDAGQPVWASRILGADAIPRVEAIKGSADGAVWVSGTYSTKKGQNSQLTVGDGGAHPVVAQTTGGAVSFVARFRADGGVAWVSQLTGDGLMETKGIGLTPTSVLVGGLSQGTASFASTGVVATSAHPPDSDFFIARLTP